MSLVVLFQSSNTPDTQFKHENASITVVSPKITGISPYMSCDVAIKFFGKQLADN